MKRKSCKLYSRELLIRKKMGETSFSEVDRMYEMK